jgi:anti-sigma regulatory factor (Ser/Thr protein kinase)
VLAEWDLAVDHELVVLLLSEAVTNAIEHGRAPSTVRVAWDSTTLEVRVRDALPGSLPVLGVVDCNSERGRGLVMLELLADAWGVDVNGHSKTLWFTLDAIATTLAPNAHEAR